MYQIIRETERQGSIVIPEYCSYFWLVLNGERKLINSFPKYDVSNVEGEIELFHSEDEFEVYDYIKDNMPYFAVVVRDLFIRFRTGDETW